MQLGRKRRLLIIATFITVIAATASYVMNRSTAQKFNVVKMLEMGDDRGALWVLYWQPGKAMESTPIVGLAKHDYYARHELKNSKERFKEQTEQREYTALSYAAKRKRWHIVKEIITLCPNLPQDSLDYCLRQSLIHHRLDIFKLLLDKGADVNACDPDGRNCFHLTVLASAPELIKLVYKRGGDVSVKDGDGLNALHMAAGYSTADALESVLELMPAAVNARDKRGLTPLCYGLAFGRNENVAILLKSGANPNVKTKNGATPMSIAIPNATAVASLLEAGADPNQGITLLGRCCNKRLLDVFLLKGADINAKDQKGYTLLHHVLANEWTYSENRLVEVVEMLLAAGANPNIAAKDGTAPIHIAASLSTSPMPLQSIMKHGGNRLLKDKKGELPIHHAARSQLPKSLELLLPDKENINCRNADGATPLHIAASCPEPECVRLLLQHGADVTARIPAKPGRKYWLSVPSYDHVWCNGDTPLLVAARKHQAEVVEILLKNGANIHDVTARGDTPLHHAAASGSEEITKLLLKNGARINVKNKKGLTPMMLACTAKRPYESRNLAIAPLLLAGATIPETATKGNTWLHKAVINGEPKMVNALIAKGFDVNAQDASGKTPLHCLAEDYNYNISKSLFRAGVKMNLLDNAKMTPLDYAIEEQPIAAISELRKAGALTAEELAKGMKKPPPKESDELMKKLWKKHNSEMEDDDR